MMKPYNNEEFPRYAQLAGKISIMAAVVGVCVFLFVWMVDVGQQEFQRVAAQQQATTTLLVLNTPPTFTLNAFEFTDSSTTTPTNSGEVITWSAVGTDSNGAPYFLLVCDSNATPTAFGAASSGALGTAPPACNNSAVQWGVSTATISGTSAFVSTTTVEFADDPTTDFAEENDWFAWVCDDDPTQPACSPAPTTGPTSTTASSSPFNMNQRPELDFVGAAGPADPNAFLDFISTSSDPDSVPGSDTLTLIICNDNVSYSTTTNSCGAAEVASSTFNPTANATATVQLPPVVRDGLYPVFGYLIDEHGHEASDNATSSFDYEVNNVAPSIAAGGDIDLNGGVDISLLVPGGETTGFTLDFTATDNNSCINDSGATSTEVTGFEVSVFRSGVGTTSCDAASADYDPNNCYSYVSGAATTTWNLSCTADQSSCTGTTDATQDFTCTFPLWFVADPTDASATSGINSPFEPENWSAAVRPVDDDGATSTDTATNTTQIVELFQAPAFTLQTADIPYGSLAPGDSYNFLGGAGGTTTTDILNIGNTGLDQRLQGTPMCEDFQFGVDECNTFEETDTIPAPEQEFGTSSSIAYGGVGAIALSSTTFQELELNVNKTTVTTTASAEVGTTYWGIAVPSDITIAGSYEGYNTFELQVSETGEW